MGHLHISDSVGAVAQDGALQESVARWPFDYSVIVGSYPSKAALDHAVHDCVVVPNMVCTGIDPGHRYSFTHFGAGTGVPASSFAAVAAAGNSYFRTGEWSGGLRAIGDAATGSRVVVTSAPQIVVNTPMRVETVGGGWWLFGGFLLFAVTLAAWLVWRARRQVDQINKDMDDFRSEADELRSRNIKEQAWEGKLEQNIATRRTARASSPRPLPMPPQATANTTTVINQGGGANDGLALGYMLGRASSPSVVVEREVVHEPSSGSGSSFDSGNADSGGGGSSYDSGSSSCDSGTSYDSGSGGGGFDSGGGGGGSDGGGGGGDF